MHGFFVCIFNPLTNNQDQYLAYFKRSWILRSDGKYKGVPRRFERNYLPMAYSVSDEYLRSLFEHSDGKGKDTTGGAGGSPTTLAMMPADLRRHDVSCTLRVHETQVRVGGEAGGLHLFVIYWETVHQVLLSDD